MRFSHIGGRWQLAQSTGTTKQAAGAMQQQHAGQARTRVVARDDLAEEGGVEQAHGGAQRGAAPPLLACAHSEEQTMVPLM